MFVLILALQLSTAVGQQGRLVSQSVVGPMRICVYGTGRHPPSVSVGRGEPCPYRYHAPDVPSATIPPFAVLTNPRRSVLSSRRVLNGRRLCVYRFGDAEYRAETQAGNRCPLTPEFAPQLTPIPQGQPQ